MDERVFKQLQKIVYDKSGIALADSKQSLVGARLTKRLRALQLEDEKAYLDYLTGGAFDQEIVQLIDAISTNVTHFFREPDHFDFLSRIMGAWLDQGRTRFRIWCAAASTGEEPYSIALTVLEAIRLQKSPIDVRILATDISTRVLSACLEGEYNDVKTQPIDPRLRNRYMTAHKQDGRKRYVVNEEVRRLLTFKRLNLSEPPYPMRGPLDVIFCRNVMIYFDHPTRQRLLREAQRLLRADGYLIVGHSETFDLPPFYVPVVMRVGSSGSIGCWAAGRT